MKKSRFFFLLICVFLVFCFTTGFHFMQLAPAGVDHLKNRPSRISSVTNVPVLDDEKNLNSSNYLIDGRKRQIVVLMWDSPSPFTWGQGRVVGTPNYGGFVVDKGECPVDCIFTSDRSLVKTADALLFDVCLTGPIEYRDIPIYFPEKRKDQYWLWFAYEQQYYFPMMKEEEYMSRFDFKMTYHYDALVQVTFTCPWGGFNTFLDPPPKKSKDKFVALFASNCNTGGATERTEYVKELMKYIPVDSYGYCLHSKDMTAQQTERTRRSHGDKMYQKVEIISQYKFLLAFENNNKVDDYVTEKMTNAFQAGTVPVYWGSPTVDRWVIGENSIIKTTDFKSPKELAEYLIFLNENDDEYMKYFEWKKKGMSPVYQRLLDNCVFYAECRLCKKLAQIIPAESDQGKNKLSGNSEIDAFAIQLNSLENRLSNHDQFVQVQHHASLNLDTQYTLVAWIKLNLIQDGRIIDKGTAGAADGYSLDVIKVTTDFNMSPSSPLAKGGPKSKLRLCAGGQCVTSDRLLYPGIWYHVAVVYQYNDLAKKIEFYINGKVDSEHLSEQATGTNDLPLRFGRAASGGNSWRPHHPTTIFDGFIDDISLWNVALSAKDIKDMMFKRLTGKEQGLVAYYGFNEGRGEIAHDSSPFKNHGNLVGGPNWVVSISKPLNDPSNLER